MRHPSRAAWATRAVLLTAALSLGAAHAQGADPAQVGQWGPLMSWPELAVHAHLLPTGKVLFSGEFESGQSVHLWDPETGAFGSVPAPDYDIFCAGHTFLPDGRLLLSGGHVDNDYGYKHSVLYDPYTNAWHPAADMQYRRWYPTVTLLAHGDVVALGGTQTPDTGTALYPERWDAATGTWRTLTGAPLDVYYYPWMFLTRTGRLFMAGPSAITRMLDVSGDGQWSSVASMRDGSRGYGSAVWYDDGKVLVVGGGVPPVATAETIDLDASAPAWRLTGSLHYARRQTNATLLPDGTVLVTGGHGGSDNDDPTRPVKAAELWDPATGQWTLLASESAYRGYHATALLLPDGRVLSAGSKGTTPTAQVFSPPYLFKGPRPTVTRAPAAVAYGDTFTVATPDAARIRHVTWLKLGSVTHSFNQSQRINHLAFSAGAGTLRVSAPADADVAPPGDYLLFVLDEAGVPSVAKVVRLTHGLVQVTRPNGGERLTAGNQASLTWDTVGQVPRVTVELSADDGASWLALATDVPNTGSLTWTVPRLATSQGRVRVRDAAREHVQDTSDGAFTVELQASTGSTPPPVLEPPPGATPPGEHVDAEGCSTAGTPGGLLGVVLLAGLVLRRRARRDPGYRG